MDANSFIAPPCAEKIQELLVSDTFLVIDKPSGLLSLSGKNPLNKDSVHYRLVKDYPSATMVHRLDFGTSGVMLIALTKETNSSFTKQFQARTVEKKYIAVVHGHVANDEGIIDAPIAKAEFPYQKVCSATGKPAQSHYQVLNRIENPRGGLKSTRLLFTPLTGRTHQLRVHCREIGHPILGCDLYDLSIQYTNIADATTKSLAKRLALHATSLAFDHPISGERVKIESAKQLSNSLLD